MNKIELFLSFFACSFGGMMLAVYLFIQYTEWKENKK